VHAVYPVGHDAQQAAATAGYRSYIARVYIRTKKEYTRMYVRQLRCVTAHTRLIIPST
jgi:hypothetical protein